MSSVSARAGSPWAQPCTSLTLMSRDDMVSYAHRQLLEFARDSKLYARSFLYAYACSFFQLGLITFQELSDFCNVIDDR